MKERIGGDKVSSVNSSTQQGETMRFVNTAEMVGILQALVKGTTIVTVDLDSPMDGKMKTTGNPFVGRGIVKRETLNGTIGYIYANAVNRIADKEGKEERQAKPHLWGDMDEKHLFRIHRKTGARYLSMQVKNVTVHGFYAPDGTQINDNEIQQFIPKKTKSSTQADLEGEVIAKDYGMDNITKIKAFSEVWCITENMAEGEREKIETTETISV
jgi:hypothetical protein